MTRFRVMLIVDPRSDGVIDALARVRESLAGAELAVQLRMKGADDAERIAVSSVLASVLPIGALLIVNDSLAVARAIAADGVHLPESNGSVRDARAVLPAGAIVGCSVHDAAGVDRRSEEGADYLVLGPLGDVPGKPALSETAFREAASRTRAPVLALGGIASAEDARRARSLGASGVAIQRGLVGRDAARLVRAALDVFDR
jgi:thiamine-phosphate pyrophosphorylase